MRYTEERYISLLTDFGFKRIFGTKPNKDLLIDFLNSLFNGEQVVKDVTFLNSEHVGDVHTDRKAIFDVYCENEKGEKFIVEMQNAYQTYFKDRSLYYATFPIREQAQKGEGWNYKLKHVYVVALLNYDMSDPAHTVQQRVKLPPPGGFLRIAVREEKLIYRNMIPGYKDRRLRDRGRVPQVR